MRVLPLLTAVLVAAAGCATHGIRPEILRQAAETDLARADGRLLDGCYDCLLEARDTYARLQFGPVGPLASSRLFGAELLIVLREQELAIDSHASTARAEAAAGAASPDLDAARLLRLVAMLPSNREGLSSAAFDTFMRGHMADARGLDDELAWLATAPLWDPVREYLRLGVVCSGLDRSSRAAVEARIGAPSGDPPLLAYRRATCGGVRSVPALEAVHAAVPGFAAAAYFLARTASGTQQHTGGARARVLAAEAYARFPQSPAATYVAGTVEQLAGDCREALRHYDETLAIVDRHENAQLGRTVCLTYLGRPEEAIAAATVLIGWQSTNVRDAYYWRAFNHRLQKRLDEARQDIDRSKRLGSTVEIRTLAGIIEYEQTDDEPARQDLDVAWSMSGGRGCPAAWYQGLVHIRREAWADAAAGFDRAMGCYAQSVADDQSALEEMRTRTDVDLDPDFRQSQIRNFTLAIEADERQRHAAAMNAAASFANAGDVSTARDRLRIAAADPSLAEAVGRLRAILDANPPAADAR
jgi:tetratricopeptide (TPR) repeat protein